MSDLMVDGRRLRRQQNREAVLDAVVALFQRGRYSPTASEIADGAGISERSLFRYFDDVDDLVRAAITRQLARIAPFRPLPCSPDGATPAKIRAVVASRVRMYDEVGATARAGRLVAHRHPVIAAQLGQVRRDFREQRRDVFGPELAPRAALLPAIDALCSFETYDLMRAGHGMSRAKVVAALVAALEALLV